VRQAGRGVGDDRGVVGYGPSAEIGTT